MPLEALTQFREALGTHRSGHMALGQWIKMGEPDKYGIALGAWGEHTEQHSGVRMTGRLGDF